MNNLNNSKLLYSGLYYFFSIYFYQIENLLKQADFGPTEDNMNHSAISDEG